MTVALTRACWAGVKCKNIDPGIRSISVLYKTTTAQF